MRGAAFGGSGALDSVLASSPALEAPIAALPSLEGSLAAPVASLPTRSESRGDSWDDTEVDGVGSTALSSIDPSCALTELATRQHPRIHRHIARILTGLCGQGTTEFIGSIRQVPSPEETVEERRRDPHAERRASERQPEAFGPRAEIARRVDIDPCLIWRYRAECPPRSPPPNRARPRTRRPGTRSRGSRLEPDRR